MPYKDLATRRERQKFLNQFTLEEKEALKQRNEWKRN